MNLQPKPILIWYRSVPNKEHSKTGHLEGHFDNFKSKLAAEMSSIWTVLNKMTFSLSSFWMAFNNWKFGSWTTFNHFVVCCCESVMSLYSDKLAHVQVVTSCRYSVAQMCTREDTHTCLFTRCLRWPLVRMSSEQFEYPTYPVFRSPLQF